MSRNRDGSGMRSRSGSASETLTGGSGTNSLWGGSGAVSDTLVGTGGTTTYGFGKGDGNDVILHSGSDDTVLLYNVSLNDVKSAAVQSSANAFVINLTDGSSLTLKGYSSNSAKTFTLGDGTSWTYSYSTKGWTKA